MSENKLDESIAKLNEALEAAKDLPMGPALQVSNLVGLSSKYLTEEAKTALTKKANSTFVTDNGIVYRAIYFAVITKTENEEKGVKPIAEVLNELAKDGLIYSCLAPISSIRLARMSLQAQTSAVFSFVLVPSSHYDDLKVKYKHIQVEEGGVGEPIEDLSVPSEDGEFFATVRVHAAYSLLARERLDSDQLVQKEIQQYLHLLPEGTQVREITNLAVCDLSIPYEVKFYHPIMKRIKSVELEYVRHAEIVEGRVDQCNLLTGLRYFGPNKEELFTHMR